jgi:hypothetical protein
MEERWVAGFLLRGRAAFELSGRARQVFRQIDRSEFRIGRQGQLEIAGAAEASKPATVPS